MNKFQQLTVAQRLAQGFEIVRDGAKHVLIQRGADRRAIDLCGRESRTQDGGCCK